jgi:hypothetical protein
MKSIDIEIAAMEYFGVRQNLIVPNVHWGMSLGNKDLHECDLLVLTKAGYATEIEIKVSKYDLLKDKDKKHKHNHNLIRRLFFAVPEKLKVIALDNIPENAGLLTVSESIDIKGTYNVELIKSPKTNKCAIKWVDKQRMKLAELGCMRLLGLKIKLNKNKGLKK